MTRKRLMTQGLQLFGLLILIIFLITIDVDSIRDVISLIDITTISGLIILIFIIITLRALRWRFIVKSLTGIQVSLPFAWISILCGVAAGSIIPGRLEGAKPMMLKTIYDVDLRISTSGMIVERIADIQSLTLLFSVAALIIFAQGSSLQDSVWYVFLVFPVLLFLLYFFPDSMRSIIMRIIGKLPLNDHMKDILGSFIEELFRSIQIINNRKTLLTVILFSLGSMVLEVARLFLILHALSIDLTFTEVSFIFSLSILIGIASLIPGAIGVYEFSSAELIHSLSDSQDMGLVKSAVLLDRTLAYYLLVLIGGIFISMHKYIFQEDSTPVRNEP